MDKIILDIPKLQDTVAQSKQIITKTKEIGKSVSDTNRKLTASGTWQGDGANMYKGKAEQWNKNFKIHENTVIKMRDAMKTVLGQAEALNRQALGFAGIVGGSSSGGTRNMLTYDPKAKTSAIYACDKAITQIDSQLEHVRRAESALSGVTGLRLSSDLSAYRRALNDQKNKLSKLKQAITRYATSAEALVTTAIQMFGGISMPEEATATMKSWDIVREWITGMLKGLNMDVNIFGGDPVNMATGNFVYEKEYLKIKGLFPLSFKVFYNAQENRVGALGSGWVHNFGASLIKGKQIVALHLEDGREVIFFENDDGTYTQCYNKYDKLRKTGRGFLYLKANDISYRFDKDGKNIKISDPNGNSASLIYEQDRLIRVENNSGGVLSYDYSPDGNITKVSDHTGRTVQLSYNDGKVCSITDEEGQEQKYRYNDKGKICGITNPLGIHILANEYDIENRISKQTFPDGGAMQYFYRDEEKELRVTEQNGNEIVYKHDGRMRSTAVIYTDGEERYAYNEQNQRTWQIDKNGNETRYDYDDRGNIAQVTNALGETICAEYNKHNKPAKIYFCGIEQMTGEYDEKGNLLCVRDALDRKRALLYNNDGKPVRLTRPDDSVIEFAYDERGNIIRVTDGELSEIKYEYDRNNRVIAVTDLNGNKTCFGYNRRDELVKVVNAEGKERTYEYNRAGKLVKFTDFDGGVSLYEYNTVNKPVRYVDQGGQETRLEYDLMWNVTKRINANGAETQFEYDKLQRLIKVTNAVGHCVKYDYDPNGNRTCVTDPQGGQMRMAYDALNRTTEVIETDGAKTVLTYNELGKIATMTDALGSIYAFAYDAVGQMTEQVDPLGNKTKYTYTALGQISSITDPAGRVTKYEYAPGGLPLREIHPDGRWVHFEYDAAKNLISKQDQSGYTLNYSYDSLNRISVISSNCGQRKSYTYDAMGNVITTTDANGNTTQYAYSATGKLTQVVDALGNKSEYGYDCTDELIEVRQFGSIDEEFAEAEMFNTSNTQLRVTIYHRNLLGQIERIEDALGQCETYSYDAFGRVAVKTDKDNYLTRYAYGQNGRLENIQYADGKTVRMSYDPLRRLAGIQDWLGATTIETDPLGRTTKVKNYNGKEVKYLYGAGGERLETVYPDEKKVLYSYDDALRLSRLTDGKSTVTYAYDNNSRLAEKRFSSGMNTRYEYNDMGLLSALTHNDHEGVLDQYAYQYDIMGNKTGIDKMRRGMKADSGKFGYSYDALGRLGNVTKDSELLRTYAYDTFGNRSQMTEGGERTTYSYNALNQLLRVEAPDLTLAYRYDARGNATGVMENGVVRNTYEFGALNRLEKATNAKGEMSLYQYNGLGQRVGRQVTDGSITTQNISYVLDITKQYHNLLQADEDGRTKSYIWDFNVISESGGEADHFYLQDELGSPLRFVGEDGGLIDSYAYDEFGNDISDNQGFAQPFGYTGYQYDAFSGTYFAQAREYDQLIGRFTARDVMKGTVSNPSSLNEYAYCWNKPLRFVDRNGLWGENVHSDCTYVWAIEAGFSPEDAEIIALYNYYTDDAASGLDPFGRQGSDQSYHFNRNNSGMDSRVLHAEARLDSAIGKWNESMRLLEEAKGYLVGDRIISEGAHLISQATELRIEALQDLGHGLHALQDIQAHGQINANDGNWGLGHAPNAVMSIFSPISALLGPWADPDDIYRDWVNDAQTMVGPRGLEPGIRFQNTMMNTFEYFDTFLIETGQKNDDRRRSGSGGAALGILAIYFLADYLIRELVLPGKSSCI